MKQLVSDRVLPRSILFCFFLLIENSEECFQKVWFSCYSTKLTNHAAWTDGKGKIQEYFTNDFTNICDCYQNESCFSLFGDNYCNCDTGDIVQREDVLRITNKVLEKFYLKKKEPQIVTSTS